MNQTERKTNIQNSFRLIKRTAVCRLCGESLPRDTEVLSFYPRGSRDQTAHICIKCIETITEVVNEARA